jgi:hypothetical protein
MGIEADRDMKLWDTVMTKTKVEAMTTNSLRAWAGIINKDARNERKTGGNETRKE